MLLRSLGSFTTLHVATLLMGWGGVGGHVNVPCTSCMIYCHAAEISGIVYYVTCCYAAEVGWACSLRSLRTHVTRCYAAEISGIVYYVTCCYAAEISGIVYYVTCCYAADLWDRLLRYMLLRCWDLWDRLLRYMLLRCWDLWDRLLRYMLLRCWDLWDRLLRYMFFVESHEKVNSQQLVPKVTSWWCMLELGNGDAFTRMLTASW